MKLAQSRKVGDPRHNVSIFSEPLSQEQVDQYYVNYRGGQRRAQSAVGTARIAAQPMEAVGGCVPSWLSA
jgi:hypothetical protein